MQFFVALLSTDVLKRERRSVEQFRSMIGCLQGISYVEATNKYNDYGCWCGEEGGPATPKDATDK